MSELPPANIALVRSVACMRSEMRRQMRGRFVRFRTLRTAERFKARMFAAVRPQLGRRCEPLAAFVAHVSLQAVVTQPMVAQHHLIFESFGAHVASERRNGGVRQHVRLEAVLA